jgi:hypothetical protein
MSLENIRNGQSTRPDVELLMKAFPSLRRDGSVVAHEEIAKIIGHQHGTTRYRTVVEAWKKAVFREYGIVLDGRLAVGEGFYPLKPAEHNQYAKRQTKTVHRRIRFAAAVVGVVPDEELTTPQRLERDHIALHLTTVEQSVSGARKAIASPPKRLESLPMGARKR